MPTPFPCPPRPVCSQRWKREIESQDSTARSSLTRGGLLLEVKEASHPVIQHLVRYLYSGLADDDFVKTRGPDVFLAAYRVSEQSRALAGAVFCSQLAAVALMGSVLGGYHHMRSFLGDTDLHAF